ncbi:phage/plasmid primase, P4 family [Streptomyces sp. NPDC057740]|uniref:DNA primase family protein n=1 Tax=Streptomyces sp. NPDC057740 TaxID=3346234 RepID=UPI0036AFD760
MTTADNIVAAVGVTDPSLYFDRDGLRAATLAEAITRIGPLAEGVDDRIWAYRDGVWRPAKNAVRDRSAELLGQRFRNSHAANAETLVRARAPKITCDPVSPVINFRNGLYEWRTGRLIDHTPDVLSTVQLGADWDPSAQCPEFERFLKQVLPTDMRGMVWEVIGYLMYSGNPLHKAVMLKGTGRNGKGTFLRVMNALLGPENVTAVSLADMVGDKFTAAQLLGKIANIAGDIDGKYLESTARFKAITGEDLVSAEHKYGDRFDFTPWAVPVFSANKIPGSADVTTGYLARWVVVDFPNDFTGREERGLTDRLITKAELSGIAAKAMPALCGLMDRGDFELPESAQAARDDFRRAVDQVRTWIDECAELSLEHGTHLNRTHLYGCYKAWAIRDGHKPVKATEFYERLESAGAVRAKRHGVRGFTGIKVTDSAGC